MITVTVGLDPTVAGHFLLRDLGLICALASEAGTRPLPVTRTAGGFEIAIADPIAGWIDLRFEVRFQHDGKGWVLHKIRQVLVIPPSRQPGLMPVRWYKGASLTSEGVPVNTPPLHPHLTVRGLAITVGSRFLDITDWFMSIHGATPWFRTLEIVRTTEFSLRVLAYLGGRPLIWYVVVPASARDAATVAPHVSYWAADFGGIDYPHDTVAGITSRNHSVSVSSPTQAVQCGGNVLCSYLLTPLTHEEYVRKAPTWAAAQARFEDSRRGPHDLMPPELHLMLPTLGL